MNSMLTLNSTDVRNEWSTIIDSVIREKPKFIKRTRDYMFLTNINVLESILSAYSFTAQKFTEHDGSITLSLNEIDLVENGKNEHDTKMKLAKAIIEYSEDFYNEFTLWSTAPNRKSHIPYIFKVLIINDVNKIGDMILCQAGKI